MDDFRRIFYKKYHTEFNLIINASDRRVIESLFAHYDRKILPKIKNFSPDSKILELGCGPGYLLDYLKLLNYNNTLGIDISKEQIEIAKSKNHKVIQTDVFDFLRNTSDSWDIVFAFDFIEHFTKDELIHLMELIYNVLNKNGLIFLRTPNGQGIFPGQVIYGDLTHQTILNPNSLTQLLIQSGFRQIYFIENSPVVKNLNGLIRLFLWKLIKLFLNFIKMVESGGKQDIWTQDFYCIAKK